MTAVVELGDIVKRFPGVVANDHVDLTLEEGEIHALLGENGAGKTTLMSVLAGIYQPDEGVMRIGGEQMTFRSPRDAIAAGIGMVHQHFRLVQPFTVAENVLLGAGRGLTLERAEVEERVAKLSEDYGIHVNPAARIWQLSVGEQQRVEILKALFRGARILILDEPTSVLTPQEAERLFVTLRQMAKDGRTIVFISHKLDEVMAVADRISVLRKGKRVATLARAEVTKTELARLMVGRDVMFRLDRGDHEVGAPAVEVTDLEAKNDLLLPALRGVSLEVRKGEILGIAGVAGNGQRELAEVIAGLRPATAGRIALAGEQVTKASAAARIERGLAYVPEDRLGVGLVGSMDCTSNVILKRLRPGGFVRAGFLNFTAAEASARELVETFDVKTPSVRAPVRLLSGGNVQKLLLARELSSKPAVLIAAQPTAGLDVGATEAIRKMLLDQRNAGVAVLLISEDLDELLTVTDRIAVMYEGKVMGVVDAASADPDLIGLMMAGTPATSRAAR